MKNGEILVLWHKKTAPSHNVNQPGVNFAFPIGNLNLYITNIDKIFPLRKNYFSGTGQMLDGVIRHSSVG